MKKPTTTKQVKGRGLIAPGSSLPSLRGAKLIAVDTETYDPNIKNGPGGVRNDGHLLGISFATDTGLSGYVPLRHTDSENWPVETARSWFNENFASSVPKIGANIMYDLEWLTCSGFRLNGPFRDVQFAEPLLDEQRRRYSLSVLSEIYLPEKERKATSTLEEDELPILGKTKGDIRQYLYQLPARTVAPYAERDATATLKVYQAQVKALEREDLSELFDLECRLIPLLLAMRLRGVRVNVKAAEQALESMEKEHKALMRKLQRAAGCPVELWAARSVAKAFDRAGVPYPKTAKTQAPSFTAEWLREHEHPLAQALLKARQLDTAINTFLKGAILDKVNAKGMLYAQFHPLRSDSNGTVSGRFSSSGPNLQQVPAREEAGAELIRSLFIPFPGEEWYKKDYSQIEYRLMVHYAFIRNLPKADYARDMYKRDPKTDFHQMVADLIERPRKESKTINFGLAYNMGEAALARKLGLPLAAAKELFRTYHTRAPFLKALSQDVTLVAARRGFIRTALKRKRRFELYEPRNNFGPKATREEPLPKDQAEERWGCNIQRAYTYKAMNALIQGSAADLMKKAMVTLYESGVYDVLGIPSLTVHDELDGSKPKGKKSDEALRESIHMMETALPLEVPVLVECAVGKNWFAGKEFK